VYVGVSVGVGVFVGLAVGVTVGVLSGEVTPKDWTLFGRLLVPYRGPEYGHLQLGPKFGWE